MARPIWSGAVSFGLVNVPVKLFSAISQKEVRFHMLHAEDGARINLKRVCSADGEEVPYSEIVKGYELSRGRYVTTTTDELRALDPQKTRTIDIQDFVELAEIDPIYYEHSYHVLPEEGAHKAYALLRDAMRSKGKVAIARMVMRTKEYLCALRPRDLTLVLSTMNYADEIVDISDVDPEALPRGKPADRELRLAEQLIESLAGPFEPGKYEDTYREEVLQMLRRKAEGEEIVVPPPAEKPEVVNLFDALKKSLEEGGAPAARREEAAPRRRKARGTTAATATAARRGRGPRKAAVRRQRSGTSRAA